ncbi:cupredoxin domain-containing protein [Candidatus Woesearchaeota archaeon]|nr:cupredoxin domain-containing protein [Candidatus Woesearchaeota archaeon]
MRVTIILSVMLCLLLAGCGISGRGHEESEDWVATHPAVGSEQESAIDRVTEEIVEVDEGKGPLKIFSVNAYQFGYEPDRIEVELGDEVMLTVTSTDVTHGFALPDFGINERVPAEESATFTFVADQQGEFRFFNPVYSGKGWKDMEGVFIVR